MENLEASLHEIHYTVNGESQETLNRTLTPAQIMEKAGIKPSENFLVEIRGRERISFKDDPTAQIEIHENEKFVTEYNGPVQVSNHG